MEPAMVKLEVYVPQEALAAVLDALHSAGAGQAGPYDYCFATSLVTGRFRPLPGSRPYTGAPGRIHTGLEVKIETQCGREKLPAVLAAVRTAHPYETPLIHVIPLLNADVDATST